jgi:signal transduction histidine kinase
MSVRFASLYLAGMIVVSAAFLGLALLVLRARRAAFHVRTWGLVCALMAATALCIGITARMSSTWLMPRLGFSFAALTTVAILLFALAFLDRLRELRSLLVVSCSLAATVILLLWFTRLLVAGVELDALGLRQPVPGPLMPLHLLLVAFNLLTSVALFALALRKAAGRQRLQLLYMLAAIGIIALASAASLTPVMQRASLAAPVTVLLIILAPSVITYAIIRHQLLDIRTVVHKTALWLAASALVVVPLWFAVRSAAPHLEGWGPSGWALAALGLLVVFALHFRFLQPWVDHRFGRRRHDPLRVLDRFNHELLHLRGARELGELIVSTVESALYASFVRLCVVDLESGELRLIAGRPCPACALDSEAARWLAGHTGPVDLALRDELADTPIARRAMELLAARGAAVALPLGRKGELLGLVTIGEKKNLRAFTREDFLLLEGIRPAATVALANAGLYDRLSELTRGLEERVEQRTRELEQANARLRELDRLKSKFFANITHELRTPLTLIIAPLEELLLSAGEPAALGSEDLQAMHRNAQRLLRLIDGLLDLAQLDAGALRLRLGDVRLNQLVEAAARSFRPLARRKGVSLAVAGLVAEGRDELRADAEKLELVLGNLLANAVKFTPAGGSIELAARAVGEELLELRVKDTGIGIPDAELERIFDRFAQVESGTTRRFEGAGIGLSLVREIVALHQGRVTVSSEPGAGSEFRVELPRRQLAIPEAIVDRREVDLPTDYAGHARRAADQVSALGADAWLTIEHERPPTPPPLAAARRVMVVEDNPDMRAYLERRLGEFFEVTSCSDGKQALALAAIRPPELVVADVMMPELSGFELCRRLKAAPATAAVPVILLTAHKGADRTLEGFRSGADDYLTKPFNLHELLARVRVQLKLVELGRRLAQREKTAVLNLVAAGLAHEVRNPVNAILNAARPLAELLAAHPAHGAARDRGAIDELLGAIVESAGRIDTLVADFLGVSRGSADEVADWRLPEAIDSTLRLLRHKHGRELRVERSFAHATPPFGRTAHLNQVLMNLLDNAARAAGPEGTICIATAQAEGRFRLAVRDGPGIPAGFEERIFDPLFTTRESPDATGLGLFLARRIVEEHGGRIWAHNAGARGAELVVELPLPAPSTTA